MPTTDDLMQDVYGAFRATYAGASPRGVILAFEPFGVMPGIDPAAPGSEGAAIEFLSANADAVPNLSGAAYAATERTISGQYLAMLSAAAPTDASKNTDFTVMKATAREAAENGAAGSALGAWRYYPAFASPPDWYDAASPDIWTHYSYAEAAPTAAQQPADPATVTSPIRLPIGTPIRLMPILALHAVPAYAKPPLTVFAADAAKTLATRAHPAAAVAAPHVLLPLASATAQRALVLRRPPPPAPPLEPPAALHPSFSMQFDYCVVRLRRPWMSGDFLSSPGWYVPSVRAGDLSAAAPTGPLSLLPTACIAVKSLRITAAGEGAGSATGFGPFALRPPPSGSADDSVSNPGVQIVAWFCEPQPMLPPQSDPALIRPSDTQSMQAGSSIEQPSGRSSAPSI